MFIHHVPGVGWISEISEPGRRTWSAGVPYGSETLRSRQKDSNGRAG